jgi:type 1 fimbria pilin
MKTTRALALIAALNLVLSSAAIAAGAKTYQITGTVVSSTSNKVILQKDSERFEIDVDPATVKGSAELKVGSTVTVTFVMSATKIEAAAGESTPAPATSPSP